MPIEAGFIVVFNIVPELIVAVEANSRSVPKRVADRIAITARQFAPVDTGFLVSSIHSESIEAGKTAIVQADAEYAAYVEYGTYKAPAQPFLGPAVAMYEEQFYLEIMAPIL
jgi:HK97 gp10 family phage protein